MKVTKIHAHPTLLLLLALAIVPTAGCLELLRGVHNRPSEPTGEKAVFKKKYCTTSLERPAPRPETTLAKVLPCPNNLAACDVGLEIVTATSPSEFENFFVDLLTADSYFDTTFNTNRLSYAHDVCEYRPGVRLELAGVQGLGYLQAQSQLPRLHALVSFSLDPKSAQFNEQVYPALADALFMMGPAPASEAALAALLGSERVETQVKAQTLLYLAHWNSNAGIDGCVSSLTSGSELAEECIMYLAKRKHTSAYNLILRRMENSKEETIRALGLLGDARALPLVERALTEARRDVQKRARALVALMNLGQSQHVDTFVAALAGSKNRQGLFNIEETKTVAFEAVLLVEPNTRRRVMQALRSSASFDVSEDPRHTLAWKKPVYASIALAQMGDETAAGELVGYLAAPEKAIREAVLDGIGSFGPRFSTYRGTGLVADARLIAPLVELYAMEPSPHTRAAVIEAIANIKGGLSAFAR